MRKRRLPLRWTGAAVVGASCLALAAPSAHSQRPAAGVELFSGAPANSEGILLGGWGSGKAREDREFRIRGDVSIRVETDGYYSGARIRYVQAKDLSNAKTDPFGLVEFTLRFQPGVLKARRQQQQPGAGGMGGPGGFGGMGSGSEGAGFGGGAAGGGTFGGSGGFGGTPGPGGAAGGAGFGGAGLGGPGFGGGAPGDFGGGMGGFPGFGGFGSSGQAIAPDTSKLKVALICEEGMYVASNFPVVLLPAGDEGWYTVGIPFVAFKGFEKVRTARLREIRVFGDSKDTFWIGQIRTSSDDEPIHVEPLDEDQQIVQGEPVEFAAVATGGLSPLSYSWDFDFSDGIQEDATGPIAVWLYTKPSTPVPGDPNELQPYKVTLTVRDRGGLKRPVVRTTRVTVNP